MRIKGYIIGALIVGGLGYGLVGAVAPREVITGTAVAAPVSVAEEAPTQTVDQPKPFDPVDAAKTVSPAALYTFVKAVQTVWPLEEEEALSAGFEVCVKRSQGQEESQIRNDLTSQTGVSARMAIVLVARAQQALCPEYR